MKRENTGERDWIARLAELQAAQASRDVTGERALRQLLAELWGLLRSCPSAIATAYRQTPEPRLNEAAARPRLALTEGRVDWRETSGMNELALELGGQLRAIDAELAERPGFAHPPSSPKSYLCKEVDAFVIPRRDAKTPDNRTGPGRGFGRRGTPHHRILPRIIADEFEVRLVWDPRLSAGRLSGTDQALGAALLPGMSLTEDPAQLPQWIARSATCPHQERLIPEHVGRCYDEDVLVMLYPELSMPPDRRGLLRDALDQRSRRMEVGKGPALVAAGSWHEPDGRGMRNMMRILDKTGLERMRYLKNSAYFRDGVEEGIIVDRTLPVLVNTDFLASFAICLDFCERELSTPYDQLDVDLILVASHGNAQTMKGHEANAGDFRARLGGQTFVVQHGENRANPVGYVLPKPEDAANFEEDRDWSTRVVRFN